MPIYSFQHPKTGEVYDVLRKFSESGDPYVVDGVECIKLINMPQIRISEAGPDRHERKEMDHAKKVKDPERARKMRKDKFGVEGISITKSPEFHKAKNIKAKGSSDVDKKQFIQSAAKNPNALAAAQKALKKAK